MSLIRAISCCPTCFTACEVWFQYGKIQPIALIDCTNCEQVFNPSNFIMEILDLRTKEKVSAKAIADKAEVFLPVC